MSNPLRDRQLISIYTVDCRGLHLTVGRPIDLSMHGALKALMHRDMLKTRGEVIDRHVNATPPNIPDF